MTDYTEHDIAQWILGAFAVTNRHGAELQFACPVCDHPSFYWNAKKGIGYCHRASCRQTFGMDAMIHWLGYGPEHTGYSVKAPPSRTAPPLALPPGVVPISQSDDAVEALATRGVTWPLIQQFRISQDDKRLYVPIYEAGTLVQYNSRKVDKSKPPSQWFEAGPKPYQYASGHPITHYFLGWDECKMWDRITLVENTFVSMWLRSSLYATATFGSHLSDVHIGKLMHSNIKHVTFLWDEHTERASQKAQRNLKALGIPSTVVNIKGQPDDHTLEELQELVNV